MNNTIEIGDVFVITRRAKWKNKPCLYADKRFIVRDFSSDMLSVYYDDNRTNIRCGCVNCYVNKKHWYNTNSDMVDGVVNRCIGVADIRVVEKRLERERDIKIKLLGL